MQTADLTRRRASIATPTLAVAGFSLLFLTFGVIFVAQRDWINASICAGYLIVVALVVCWIRSRAAHAPPEASSVSDPTPHQGVRTFTRWEAVGHAGMACLYVAALAAGALTGDWGWPLAAALSSAFGVLLLGAQMRRGSVPSQRDVASALL